MKTVNIANLAVEILVSLASSTLWNTCTDSERVDLGSYSLKSRSHRFMSCDRE